MPTRNTETIRRENKLAVVHTLRAHGPMARIDLGPATGLSSATVTSITSEFLGNGLIAENSAAPVRNGGRGRPKMLIDLEARAAHVVCIKLSINEIRLVVGDFKRTIHQSIVHTLDTRALDCAELVAFLIERVEALHRGLEDEYGPLVAICIAVQGVASPVTGMLLWSPALSFRNQFVSQPLADVFACPVIMGNDANCVANAIRARPEFGQYRNLAVVMLGYGVGMSVVMDGHHCIGATGSAAEFGHTKYEPDGALCACGRRGCIEAYVGDYALYREASEFLDLPPGDSFRPSEEQMQAIVAQARAGNPQARQLFANAGHVLGHGLANVLALFNPERVLITGYGVRAFDWLQPAMEQSLRSTLVRELISDTRISAYPWDHDLSCLGGITTALEKADPALVDGKA